ncbi:MAG: hypothetical protein IKS48_12420 [Eubacterium sp.]|nr:hypothetical protein [Eubacterium sp.]
MRLLKVFLIVIICAFCLNVGFTVHADDEYSGYSEEEKEAAKAWLSAHGYPPTRAGAEMAYQDYLNGKFDDDPDVAKYRRDNGDDTDSTNDTDPTEQTTETSEEKTTESTGEDKKSSDTSGADDGKKVASGAGVVTDKKLGESLEETENMKDKLSDPKLKMDNPSEVKLVEKTGEDQIENRELSDILLLAGVMSAVGFILFAVKAGGNKKQDNDDSDI